LRFAKTDRWLWVVLSRLWTGWRTALVIVKPETVRDHVFESLGAMATAMGIEEVLTAPHAPWQNAFVERFVGSAHRECLDHVIVFNEAGLRKLMKLYCSYYEKARTHLALDKDAPIPGRVMPPGDGDIVANPEVGGLHHRYERRPA
jgi:putative transposase